MGRRRSVEELFAGRHFDREVIILCVRWYLGYELSFRDLVEMMAERELDLAHTTILRWVRRFAPEFIKRWNRFGRSAGRSWRVDETYIKVRGEWTYLYRAVDKLRQELAYVHTVIPASHLSVVVVTTSLITAYLLVFCAFLRAMLTTWRGEET